jgi:D-sedoheptulose 7-phosphate isomerase
MHCREYLVETAAIARSIDPILVEALAVELYKVRQNEGRVYVIGLGGSMANAIHMTADLRKLCEIDAHCLSNIAELTARANDEGLDTIFTGWLTDIGPNDALFVLSVGGGTQEVSKSITDAVMYARAMSATVLGIVGPNGGATARFGTCVLTIPANELVTPHTEAFQAVIWHCLVSHPTLQRNATKWP